MKALYLKIRFLIPTFVLLSFVAFLTPVSANFFPFRSKKMIPPDQYAQREDQINRYNEQAIELFEEGHFEEAQELWEKAIEIMEGTDRYSQEHQKPLDELKPHKAETIVSKEENKPQGNEIDELYQSAVSLFKKQKYVAAKKLFDRVESRIPDYKATRNYRIILNYKIKQAQQTLSGDKRKANSISRHKEREEWKRILEESEKELEKKLLEQVAPLYKEAVRLYKSRKFKLARDYFFEADSIMPHYKDTTKYLVRVDEDIRKEEQRILEEKNRKKILERKKEQEEWERSIEESERKLQEQMRAQAAPIYQEALDYYKQRQFELAKDRFQEVEQILPAYKSVEKYLARIDQDAEEEAKRREQQRLRELARKMKEEEIGKKREEERLAKRREEEEKKKIVRFQEEVAARRKEREAWLKVLEDSEKERKRKVEAQAEFVYREAVQLYKRQQLEPAKNGFLEVGRIIPDYKSTAKYLARIDRDVEEERKQHLAERQRMDQKKMREERIAKRQQEEEYRRLRAAEDQNRLHKFKKKAAERKRQREEWERVLKKNKQERQKKLKEEAEFIYQEAVRLYKEQKWERARNGFMEAEQILPGYKRSEKYLSRIDRGIDKAKQRRKLAAEKANKRRERQEALARKQEENRQKKVMEADQKKQLKENQKQAEAVYKFAQSLYKRGNYAQANDKFLEVQRILPGYKSTNKFIQRIDADILKAKREYENEQRLAFQRQLHAKKIAEKKEEEKLNQARQAEEKKKLEQLRKEAAARRKERMELEKTNKEIQARNQKHLRQQAESIYQEALRYFEAGWFQRAKEAFDEVESTVPGYKSTAKYLVKTGRKIRRETRLHEESEKRIKESLEKEKMLSKKREKEAEAWKLKIAKEKQKQKLVKQRKPDPVKKIGLTVPEKNGNKVVQKAVRERQKALSKKTKVKYREALRAYKAKEFVEAKLKFIDVESLSPGYKATLKYLKNIDEKIARQKKRLKRENNADSKGKPDLKIHKPSGNFFTRGFHRILPRFAHQDKGPPLRSSASPRLRRNSPEVLAKEDRSHQASLTAVAGRGTGVRKNTPPPPINTQGAMKKDRDDILQNALSREERNFQKKKTKQDSKQKRVKKKEPQSQKVVKTRSGQEYHKRDLKKELKRQRRIVQQKYDKQFRQLYNQAVGLYRSGSYEEAEELFLQIEQMKPGYKKASSYLKKAKGNIAKGLQKGKHNNVARAQKAKTRVDIISDALDAVEQSL